MSTRSTRRLLRSDGFSSLELLVALAVTAIGIALASGMMLAGKSHVRQQEKELEATHAGRAALETILRELRLGGACLPETGEFISLEATDNGNTDELTTRYGMTRPNDMSCIQTATSMDEPVSSTSIELDDIDGFEIGTLVYLRHTNGTGEYFTVTGVDTTSNTIVADRALSATYPATSGVYAIDERHFSLDTTEPIPLMMFRVGSGEAKPFALGIETLNIEYEFSDGTMTGAPANDQAWRTVRQIHVDLTSRSFAADASGSYFRRNFRVAIKPRNLIDS